MLCFSSYGHLHLESQIFITMRIGEVREGFSFFVFNAPYATRTKKDLPAQMPTDLRYQRVLRLQLAVFRTIDIQGLTLNYARNNSAVRILKNNFIAREMPSTTLVNHRAKDVNKLTVVFNCAYLITVRPFANNLSGVDMYRIGRG